MWPQWGVGNRQRWLWTCLSGLVIFLLAEPRSLLAHEMPVSPFPVPEVLRPNIAFWKRIFSALDTNSGVLHDADNVTIIYHTFASLPAHPRKRQRVIDRQRHHYQRLLYALARSHGRPQNQEEKRVLAMFPRQTSSAFRTAARNMRFQQGLRDQFAQGLARSGAYLHDMAQIFSNAGLPADLAFLPHVESSFDNRAYSWAGAAGVWQFIPSTGRRFLTIDEVIDERFDIHRASTAAARLLWENYQELGTWPLAITAYNHGVYGMKRAVETLKTKDFGTIVQRYRSPSFGFASKNFYAEFLAVLAIVKNPTTHFTELTVDTPRAYNTLELDAYVTMPILEKHLGLDRHDIARWNPALRPSVLQAQKRLPKGFVLKIPQAHLSPEELQARWDGIPLHLKSSEQIRPTEYRVQPGDTLSTIARRFGTTTSVLITLNNLKRSSLIRVGQRLRLPHTMQESKSYRVQPGDTLWTIAQRFDTTVSTLAALNDIPRPYRIHAGQRLQLPQPSMQQVSREGAPDHS